MCKANLKVRGLALEQKYCKGIGVHERKKEKKDKGKG
jgi:hypothetical protein